MRVRAALTCGTDLKLLARGHPRIPLPVTMGHEACGEIASLGEGVEGFALGERVVPGISGPCRECTECLGGRANLCSQGFADRSWGAFAEYLRVPSGVVAANLHRVSPSLSDAAAAFLDPLASVLHGWNRLRDPRGTVLLYGAGALALLWSATARRRGLHAVVAGRRAERLLAAAALGADTIDTDREAPEEVLARGGALPEVAVDCTGSPEIWRRLAHLVRPGGQVLLFGGCAPGSQATWDAARLHYSEVSLVGSFHYTPEEAGAAMAMLAAGEVDPLSLLTDTGGLSDLPRFLEAQARGEGIRYGVVPS